MENPASWNKVEKAIDEAMSEFHASVANMMAGPSIVRRIYKKLSTKGYLKPEFTE